ncbi:hypothetical protein Amet_0145 [Alkaliphilus metalliredigens QYMF]|uniref:Uncharacterized protein n=1 Tax=Alkaliphilus metalliredigens (strain QYMF) TaxID=293826 RepID=A6TJL6_ALKMQ|nr:DUF3189 family protein [Alkaliphilus metalliredigens]ABR46384.1 hypothetical protein Amet_0145 [Alkaliphilus metalliredigens QYMF]
MYIIYYGTGTALTTSVAASIHLSDLTNPEAFQKELVRKINEFWLLEQQSLGHLYYLGTDSLSHDVFLMNVAQSETIVLPGFKSVFEILQLRSTQYLLVDTTSFVTVYNLLGFNLYKRNLFRKLGHRCLLKGIEKNLSKIFLLVENTKKQLENKDG